MSDTGIRVTNIAFDTDQNPAEVTVVMSARDAAWLARMHGNLCDRDINHRETDVASGRLYSCLAYGVFNPYWEEGIEGYIESLGGSDGN